MYSLLFLLYFPCSYFLAPGGMFSLLSRLSVLNLQCKGLMKTYRKRILEISHTRHKNLSQVSAPPMKIVVFQMVYCVLLLFDFPLMYTFSYIVGFVFSIVLACIIYKCHLFYFSLLRIIAFKYFSQFCLCTLILHKYLLFFSTFTFFKLFQ